VNREGRRVLFVLKVLSGLMSSTSSAAAGWPLLVGGRGEDVEDNGATRGPGGRRGRPARMFIGTIFSHPKLHGEDARDLSDSRQE
jgi:hypothetical protein